MRTRDNMPPHTPLSCSIDARSSIVVGEPRGGLLAPAKDQRTAPLLLTLVCCRFRDRSTGPVGGCGASTGGWNSGRRQQERAPGRVPWMLTGSWPLASGSARCACSSQPQAVCFGQQAGRHDALRRAEGELPGCRRRAAPAEPPGPSAAPDPRAEAECYNRRSMLHFRRC